MADLGRRMWALLGVALGSGLGLSACSEDTTPTLLEPDAPATMAVGEQRTAELRFLRLDVEGFQKEHTLEDLQAMPRRVLEDVWLLDLDATPLMINALEGLRGLPPAEVEALPPAARNMHRLLTMTPDNAVLEGTSLEQLIELSAAVGIPPAKALANLLGVGVTDDFIPPEIVAAAMQKNVVGTHPASQFRKGPVDDEHPDGLYPVAPNSIPVTMADVVTNFENMAARFGPTDDHPGFILEAHGVTVVEEAFKLISKVNANALPFKGLDLTSASVASVNSIGSQIETVHDFADPNWMVLEGMVENAKVETLTFRVIENDAFVPGGTSREPEGQGNSGAWDLPVWEFEPLILEMSRNVALSIPAHCDTYELATGVAAFTACIDDAGWVTLETFNNVGAPPAPSYLWDLNLEIAEVRLHDGGLAEGEADIELTVHDVEVGVPPEVLIEQARENVKANPEALREFASLITSSTVGDADFYYYRSDAHDDWLYFVSDKDIRLDDDGEPVREYTYDNPGFFGDRALTNKVSTLEEIDGDREHEKVRVRAGDVLYVRDDEGRTYEVTASEKPSRAWLALEITRLD